MDKKEYSNIKKYIRSLCIDSVRELGTNVGLTDYEIKLLEHIVLLTVMLLKKWVVFIPNANIIYQK